MATDQIAQLYRAYTTDSAEPVERLHRLDSTRPYKLAVYTFLQEFGPLEGYFGSTIDGHRLHRRSSSGPVDSDEWREAYLYLTRYTAAAYRAVGRLEDFLGRLSGDDVSVHARTRAVGWHETLGGQTDRETLAIEALATVNYLLGLRTLFDHSTLRGFVIRPYESNPEYLSVRLFPTETRTEPTLDDGFPDRYFQFHGNHDTATRPVDVVVSEHGRVESLFKRFLVYLASYDKSEE